MKIESNFNQRFVNEQQDNFVISITGIKGSGKTLVLTLLLYLDYLRGRKIYTNFPVSFPFEFIDIQKMVDLNIELENCTIGLTELHAIADSRLSGKKQNILMSYFVLQSRHRHVNFYYDSQFGGQVDKRIRTNVDVDIVCENLYFDYDNDGLNDTFRIVIHDRRFGFYQQKYFYGKPIFQMYNGNVIINPFTMKEVKK